MNYKIEKIKSTSKNFEGIKGMEVLTYISPVTKKKYVDGPTDIKSTISIMNGLEKKLITGQCHLVTT